jgi:hypothetical protein
VAVELPANLLGNYRLLASSPAINLGAPSKNGVNAPATDFDNESRPAGGGYDSGADEYWAIVGLRQPWVQRLPLLFR